MSTQTIKIDSIIDEYLKKRKQLTSLEKKLNRYYKTKVLSP